jgi:DNA-binding NarL/FixJ family response regulator
VRAVLRLNSEATNKRTAGTGPKEETFCQKAARLQSRLFLVDDHPAVRRGLRVFLGMQTGLTICGEAEDEHQALESILELKPDLAVVDLRLKEGSGLSLIQRLRQLCPTIRILVFSMCGQVRCAVYAFRQGAHGYVTKDEGLEAIVEAIQALVGGGRYLSGSIAAQDPHLLP